MSKRKNKNVVQNTHTSSLAIHNPYKHVPRLQSYDHIIKLISSSFKLKDIPGASEHIFIIVVFRNV